MAAKLKQPKPKAVTGKKAVNAKMVKNKTPSKTPKADSFVRG